MNSSVAFINGPKMGFSRNDSLAGREKDRRRIVSNDYYYTRQFVEDSGAQVFTFEIMLYSNLQVLYDLSSIIQYKDSRQTLSMMGMCEFKIIKYVAHGEEHRLVYFPGSACLHDTAAAVLGENSDEFNLLAAALGHNPSDYYGRFVKLGRAKNAQLRFPGMGSLGYDLDGDLVLQQAPVRTLEILADCVIYYIPYLACQRKKLLKHIKKERSVVAGEPPLEFDTYASAKAAQACVMQYTRDSGTFISEFVDSSLHDRYSILMQRTIAHCANLLHVLARAKRVDEGGVVKSTLCAARHAVMHMNVSRTTELYPVSVTEIGLIHQREQDAAGIISVHPLLRRGPSPHDNVPKINLRFNPSLASDWIVGVSLGIMTHVAYYLVKRLNFPYEVVMEILSYGSDWFGVANSVFDTCTMSKNFSRSSCLRVEQKVKRQRTLTSFEQYLLEKVSLKFREESAAATQCS